MRALAPLLPPTMWFLLVLSSSLTATVVEGTACAPYTGRCSFCSYDAAAAIWHCTQSEMYMRDREADWQVRISRLACNETTKQWMGNGTIEIRRHYEIACAPVAMTVVKPNSSNNSSSIFARLPEASSAGGIAMICISLALVVSLVVLTALMMKRLLKRLIGKKRERTREESSQSDPERAQPEIAPPPPSIPAPAAPAEPKTPEVIDAQTEEWRAGYANFLKEWKVRSYKDRMEFLEGMSDEFLVSVTPGMLMDTLATLLEEETSTELWILMLRLTLKLERDLFHWDQTAMEHVPEDEKTVPSQTHERFQAFLKYHAAVLLRKYGGMARPGEEPEAGFMRFVAFLFGFVCGDERILTLMEHAWAAQGYAQPDASRAMVWGYRRFLDDPIPRVRGRPAPTESSNGQHVTFYQLMRELRGTRPHPRPEEAGSRAQHLLFALGCGAEVDWAEGPLAHMNNRKQYPDARFFYGVDYLWLMMGRDLARGNAWSWMCRKDVSEHDRMCARFGQEGRLYEHVVDTVAKYEEDAEAAGGNCIMTFALRFNADVEKKFDFGEHRAWLERYLKSKRVIGDGINAWLLKNGPKGTVGQAAPRDPRAAVDHYTQVAMKWEAGKLAGSPKK